jgi:ferredoxin-type protein NapF
MQSVSRANLLRGRLRAEESAIRPPWARQARDFAALCDGCGRCVEACPEKIITQDDQGYPAVDFARGGCSFCGDCVRACPTGALVDEGGAPWHLIAEIGPSCFSFQGVICRACQDRCEANAISFRPILGGYYLPQVDAAACNGCGACVAACPLPAIEMRETA